jgi:hypothetical protein
MPTRQCQRPGCAKRVRDDADRFCSVAHDLADQADWLAEKREKRQARAAAAKVRRAA